MRSSKEGRGRGVRPVPGAVRAGGGGLEDPGHAASSTTYDTYGSRTVTHWHDQVTPEEPHPIEKAVLPSAAAAHGRVGTHCPPRNRWQRRTGRASSWPRPAQHHQLDPIALALVKRDTAMSRSCQSVLRCGVEPLEPRRLSACLRCLGPRTLDMDVTGRASLAFWQGIWRVGER